MNQSFNKNNPNAQSNCYVYFQPKIQSQTIQRKKDDGLILQLPPNIYRDFFPILQSPNKSQQNKKAKSHSKYKLSQPSKTSIKNPQTEAQEVHSRRNTHSGQNYADQYLNYNSMVCEQKRLIQKSGQSHQMNQTFIKKNKIHHMMKKQHNRHISMSYRKAQFSQALNHQKRQSNYQKTVRSQANQNVNKIHHNQEQNLFLGQQLHNHSKRVKSKSWGKSPNKIEKSNSSTRWFNRMNQLNHQQLHLKGPLRGTKCGFSNIDQQIGDMANKVCIIDSQKLNRIRFLNRKKFESDFLYNRSQKNQISSIMEYLMMKNQILGEKLEADEVAISNFDRKVKEGMSKKFATSKNRKVDQQKITPLSNKNKAGIKYKQREKTKTGFCPSPWQYQKET